MAGSLVLYDARGHAIAAAAQPAPARRRMGTQTASGVSISYGRFEYERNAALRGTKRWETFAKMATDPHVKSALRFVELPLRMADWTIEPASEDPRDVEIAEFVAANLFQQDSDRFGPEYWVQSPWRTQHLPEILKCLEHGFSLFTTTWRVVDDKQVYDRIQWLEPSTLDGIQPWVLDEHDNVLGIRRRYMSPDGNGTWRDEFIEEWRLKLYAYELVGARYEGTPFTRSQFGAWFRKDFVLKQMAINAQKTGSPPPLAVVPRSYEGNQVLMDRVEEYTQSLRGSSPEFTYGVFTHGEDGEKPEFSYVGSDKAEPDRMARLVEMENAELAHGGGTKTMLAGETAYGSRSTAETQGPVEWMHVDAAGEMVCSFLLNGPANLSGLIMEMCDRNYAGLKRYPRPRVSNTNPHALTWLAKELGEIADKGLIEIDDDVQRQVGEWFGLKLDAKKQAAAKKEREARQQQERDDKADEMRQRFGNGAKPQRAAASMSLTPGFAERMRELLQPQEGAPKGARFRPVTRLEARVMNLAAVEDSLRVGERDALTDLREIRYRMSEELLRRLDAGKITTRSLDSMRRLAFRGRAGVVDMLADTLGATARKGIEHVESEVERGTEPGEAVA